jgi:hypothetical protein
LIQHIIPPKEHKQENKLKQKEEKNLIMDTQRLLRHQLGESNSNSHKT